VKLGEVLEKINIKAILHVLGDFYFQTDKIVWKKIRIENGEIQ
jgi:hypothetical protein